MTEDLMKNEQFIRLSTIVSALITQLRLKGYIDRDEVYSNAVSLAEDHIKNL